MSDLAVRGKPNPYPLPLGEGEQSQLDAETWNRYRLRWREAVRDPSAKRASLASVRMTDWASVARFGQDDERKSVALRGEPNPLTPFPVKEGEPRMNFDLFPLREGNNRAGVGGILSYR